MKSFLKWVIKRKYNKYKNLIVLSIFIIFAYFFVYYAIGCCSYVVENYNGVNDGIEGTIEEYNNSINYIENNKDNTTMFNVIFNSENKIAYNYGFIHGFEHGNNYGYNERYKN